MSNLNNMFDDDDLNDAKANVQNSGMSAQSINAIVNNLDGVVVTALANVTDFDDFDTDEAVIVVRIIDRSPSMGGVAADVIDAANLQLEALTDSKGSGKILAATWTFSSDVSLVHSFVPLTSAMRLDKNNYDPSQGYGTALYKAIFDAISATVPYVENLLNNGARVTVAIIIMSDGLNNEPGVSQATIKTLITDLIAQELYTVAFVGLGIDAKTVAGEIGIPDGNILSAGSTTSEIRRAMRQASISVIQVSNSMIGSNSFFK